MDNPEIIKVRIIFILDRLKIVIKFKATAPIVLDTPTSSEILKCSIYCINYCANIYYFLVDFPF